MEICIRLAQLMALPGPVFMVVRGPVMLASPVVVNEKCGDHEHNGYCGTDEPHQLKVSHVSPRR